jgi:DNA polymerase-1
MVGSGRSKEYYDPAIRTARELGGYGKLNLTDAIEILGKAGHSKAIEIWKPWKEGRKKAKAINFGFVFGMYENKFIQQAKTKYQWDCTYEEAQAFRQAYFELYRGIPPWHDKQKALVRSDGYVRNLFGRLRRLPGIYSSDKELRSECERQAINAPVQGTIGDWKAAALIEIEESIPHDQLRIVGEHHDALLIIFRDEFRDLVLPRVRAIMRRPKLLDIFKVKTAVPMDSEIEIGNWGAGKAYEDPPCQ